jgi:two-component system, NarL family, response regulator DesR
MSDRSVTPEPARVAVFAHTPVIATGLSDLLHGVTGIAVIGATTSLHELVELIVDGGARAVVTEVLNDSENPSHVFDTVRSTDRVTGAPVTVVCVIPSPAGFALDLTRRGAAAVVSMTDDPDQLRRAVVDATTARLLGGSSIRDTIDAHGRPALTARELDVLQGMVDGHSSREIASDLGVTVNTVRTHVQRLLPKLGAHNRLRAAAVAIELGLVTPSVSRVHSSLGC